MNKVVTVLDGEWDFCKYDYTSPYTGKVTKLQDGTPYNTNNKLVSIGVMCSDGSQGYAFFEHSEKTNVYTNDGTNYVKGSKKYIQEILNRTKLLIGHNLKADMQWLLACGFTIPNDVQIFDTFICEYVFNKGQKKSLKLKHCCEYYGLDNKLDVLDKYTEDGVAISDIPYQELQEYGMRDIKVTNDLYKQQIIKLKNLPNRDLTKQILKVMNSFTRILTGIEVDGCQVDIDVLNQVEKEYIKEKDELSTELNSIIKDVMGDTPVNINSPEQLSQLVFGFKVVDKEQWKLIFNIGSEKDGARKGKAKYKNRLTSGEIKTTIHDCCEWLYRTVAKQCKDCKGFGSYYKIKKDGNKWKKPTNCKTCKGTGVVYQDTDIHAGLGVMEYNYEWASIGGFSAGSDTIKELLKLDLNEKARDFLSKLSRYNSISTYLNNFIGGIKKRLDNNNRLHIPFNQCLTNTGRLSSPFHNLPRGNTFPVKKAIKSRWENGKILDCDFGQLEFRIAAILSKCPAAVDAINKGVDVHAFSRDTLDKYGFPFENRDPKQMRQRAKEFTFKPLYGGISGTPPEVKYYQEFLTWLYGVDSWQKELGLEAVEHKQITTPTGRTYRFPYAAKTKTGRISSFTQIVNYPVQGVASDIVMLTICNLYNNMIASKVKSKIILTVHDSVTCDIYPGEEEIMIDIYKKTFDNIGESIKQTYGIDCIVPLAYDLEIGNNWMEKKEIQL